MDKKIYRIKVGKEYIDVEHKVYEEFYKLRERERYLNKLAAKNNISLEGCQEKGVSVEFKIVQRLESIEDTIVKAELIENMLKYIDTLSTYEKLIINELFLNRYTISEKNLAEKLGIPRTTLQSHKYKILKKFRKFLKI